MRPWESVPATPAEAAYQPASAGRGPDRVTSGGWVVRSTGGFKPLRVCSRRYGRGYGSQAMPSRFVVVPRIVARLAAPGGGQADRSRGRAVRRCRGMPERHRQRPARKILDDRVEETGKGKGGERRHPDPMPMPAQPGHG
jgi:hypothetical protein